MKECVRPTILDLLYIAIVSTLIPRLFDSFWLDEFAATFASHLSWNEVITFRWMNLFPSPPYYFLTKVSTSLFDGHEWSLRLAAFLAALVGGWVVYRLSLNLFREVAIARLAGVFFVALPSVRDQMVNARPYTLVMLLIALAVYSWTALPKSSWRRILLASAASALALYSQPLSVLVLGSIAIGALIANPRESWRAATGVCILTTVLCVPLVSDALALWGMRASLYPYKHQLPLWYLVVSECWPVIAVIGIRALSARGIPGFLSHDLEATRRNAWPLLLCWCVLPVLALIGASLVGDVNITFFPRYLGGTAPAFAIILAIAVSRTETFWVRQTYTVLIALALLLWPTPLAAFKSRHLNEDWRGLAATINQSPELSGTPILLISCWPESNDITSLSTAPFNEYFSLPLRTYAVSNPIVHVPFDLDSQPRRIYLEDSLKTVASSSDAFLLTSCELKPIHMAAIMSDLGPKWSPQFMGTFGRIPLVRVVKDKTER